MNEYPNQRINVFAPDCSGKLRDFEIYFFMGWQSDQRKLLLARRKKDFKTRTCNGKLE
jgi:hypothetical protein